MTAETTSRLSSSFFSMIHAVSATTTVLTNSEAPSALTTLATRLSSASLEARSA